MPRRLIIIFTAGLITLGVIVLALGCLHRSLWSAWEMAPPGQLVLGINLSQPGAGLGLHAARLLLPEEVPAIQMDASRFVYSRQGAGETLVIVPRVRTLAAAKVGRLRSALEREAWHVGRRGGVIWATRGGGAPPTSSRISAQQAAGRLARAAAPKQPLLVAAASPGQLLPPLSQPLAVLVTADETSEEVVITTSLVPSLATRPNSTPSAMPSADLIVRLPGSSMAELPPALQQAWQEKMSELIGFTELKESLIPAFSQIQEMQLAVHNNVMTLGVSGNPEQVMQHLQRILEEQYARQRPVTRSFPLPDGTLGRETVPGALEPVLEESPDPEGCRSPLPNRTNLWLCRQGNAVALSATKEGALTVLQPLSAAGAPGSARWQVQAAGAAASLLGIPELTSINAAGDTSTAEIVLRLRQ